MLFSKKLLKNHPQFLLHFLLHIDVLMLCRKFDLITTKTFVIQSCTCTCTLLVHYKCSFYDNYNVYFIFYRHPSVMDAVFVEEKKGDRKKMIEKFFSLFLPGTYHEVKNLTYMYMYMYMYISVIPVL